MNNQIQIIAMRIRDLREIAGLTPEAVSAQAGIPTDEYRAYEAGEKDFSFSHLFNIASVLGVDISDLLTGESPKLTGYIVTRSGKGLAFDRRKAYHYEHLAYNFRDKKAEPFIVTVEYDPANAPKTAHAHEGQELDYVLEGSMKIVLDKNEVYLGPGDSIYYDSSLPHAMYALEADCRFIAVVIK
ncbi:MAG: helix-turn-helix domain-containing protein [Christensenellales bacterium]|jgi:transcriptional regulator with XRE-family HTH domain